MACYRKQERGIAMPKFFVDPQCIQPPHIVVENDNVNHIKNVLRLGVGDEILINDRQGNDYKCIMSAIEQQRIVLDIIEHSVSTTEPAIEVTLFQSLIKGEKMEWVIQKAVEIGATCIVPMITKYCVVKIETDKKIQAKVARWNKIAEAAAKQSGRGVVPQVVLPMTLDEVLTYTKDHQLCSIIPYEKETTNGIRHTLQTQHANHYGVLIGPEGGFAEEELQKAAQHGVRPVTLGRRILRSETASLVALANIMYEMGEMGE